MAPRQAWGRAWGCVGPSAEGGIRAGSQSAMPGALSGLPCVQGVKDVPAEAFIKAFAAHLKKNDKVCRLGGAAEGGAPAAASTQCGQPVAAYAKGCSPDLASRRAPQLPAEGAREERRPAERLSWEQRRACAWLARGGGREALQHAMPPPPGSRRVRGPCHLPGLSLGGDRPRAQVALPDWVDFAKTGAFKELAPLDPDWYYIRAGEAPSPACPARPAASGPGAFGGRQRCPRSKGGRACAAGFRAW